MFVCFDIQTKGSQAEKGTFSAHAENSLMFLKATESIEHGGGARLDLSGPGATRILSWIRSGAPRLRRRRLVNFTVTPTSLVLNSDNASIPVAATATFDDGTKTGTGTAIILSKFQEPEPESTDRSCSKQGASTGTDRGAANKGGSAPFEMEN